MTFVHLRWLNITMIHVHCNAEFVGFVHRRKIVRFVRYRERLQGRETRFISALDCHALRIPFFLFEFIAMYILILQYIALQIKVYEYLWLEAHCELLLFWFFKVVYKNKRKLFKKIFYTRISRYESYG